MENPIKMDDLGGKNTIFGNTHVVSYRFLWFLRKNVNIFPVFLPP